MYFICAVNHLHIHACMYEILHVKKLGSQDPGENWTLMDLNMDAVYPMSDSFKSGSTDPIWIRSVYDQLLDEMSYQKLSDKPMPTKITILINSNQPNQQCMIEFIYI